MFGLREAKFFVAGILAVGFIIAFGALRHAFVVAAAKFIGPI